MRLSPSARLSCAVTAIAAPLIMFVTAAPASASGNGYVALGDSYTSGPLILPGGDAAPVHPNAAGEAADAQVVEAAMQAAGI